MTTKRDDTKDLMFRRGEIDKFFSAVTDGVTLPAILPWPSNASLVNDSRYVPYEQYAALEKERDELLATVDKLTDKTIAIEEFHERDTDGSHVLVEAYLMYRCVKCDELLYQEDSDEPIDGLTDDLNGYAVTCKCGAEYIGRTIDTPELSLIQAPPEPYDNECPEVVPGFNYRG